MLVNLLLRSCVVEWWSSNDLLERSERGFFMANELQGKKIAFLVAPEGVEQVELTEPWEAVESAGGTPELLSTASGEVQAFNHLDKADTFPVDRVVSEAIVSELVSDYDALVLPGGVANPDLLRMNDAAVSFVRAFFENGGPIGVICHGPWMLVEADVLRYPFEGGTWEITSWPSLRKDILNADGKWVDKEVVEDFWGIVSSRKPEDLPAFCSKIVEEFAMDRPLRGKRAVR
jgi:protease I